MRGDDEAEDRRGYIHYQKKASIPHIIMQRDSGSLGISNTTTSKGRTGGLARGRDGLVAVLGRGSGDASGVASVLFNMPAHACMHACWVCQRMHAGCIASCYVSHSVIDAACTGEARARQRLECQGPRRARRQCRRSCPGA